MSRVNDAFLYTGITSASSEPTGSIRELQKSEKEAQSQVLRPKGIEVVLAKLAVDKEALHKVANFNVPKDLEDFRLEILVKQRQVAYINSLEAYFKGLLPKEPKQRKSDV